LSSLLVVLALLPVGSVVTRNISPAPSQSTEVKSRK
jgi:hypothetical protein